MRTELSTSSGCGCLENRPYMGLLSVCREFSCQPGFGAIRRGFSGAKLINVYVENANFKERVREWKMLYITYVCIELLILSNII